MVTARAVTDESGRIVVRGNIKASSVSMNDTIAIERTPEPHNWTKCKFGDLIGNEKFSQLVDYLKEKLDPGLREVCEYGNNGQVKWLKHAGKTYWSKGRKIFDRYRK